MSRGSIDSTPYHGAALPVRLRAVRERRDVDRAILFPALITTSVSPDGA
jgi:hypothetical protein